jgi:hypothetical protein
MSGWLFGGWPPPPPGAGGAVDIGDLVGFGTPESVLFIDPAGELAQDPGGFFDYHKATHTLKRKSVAGGQTVLEEWTPGNAGAPILTKRLGGGSFFGTWDPVYYLGFNQENQDPAHGQIAIQMEGLFQYANGPARYGQEFHLVHTQRGGANPLRFLSFLGDEDPAAPPGGNGRGVGFRGDGILFVDNQDDTRTMEFRDGNLNMQGGAGGGGSILFGNNNRSAILQLNAGGTNFQELLMFDSADHGRLFRGTRDWYGNSAQPAGAMRFGAVNDADNTTANAAEVWLNPIGGTPGYSVAGVLSAYNPGDTTNRTGVRLKRFDGTSLYSAIDVNALNGSVIVGLQAAQTAAMLDLSAAAAAGPPLIKGTFSDTLGNIADIAGYFRVQVGGTSYYVPVLNAAA